MNLTNDKFYLMNNKLNRRIREIQSTTESTWGIDYLSDDKKSRLNKSMPNGPRLRNSITRLSREKILAARPSTFLLSHVHLERFHF